MLVGAAGFTSPPVLGLTVVPVGVVILLCSVTGALAGATPAPAAGAIGAAPQAAGFGVTVFIFAAGVTGMFILGVAFGVLKDDTIAGVLPLIPAPVFRADIDGRVGVVKLVIETIFLKFIVKLSK
jgi:hypothetical protein